MNTREAVLEAADFLERNPNAFNFLVCTVPESLSDQGCYLGWINYFQGEDFTPYLRDRLGRPFVSSEAVIGPTELHEADFFSIMSRLSKNMIGSHPRPWDVLRAFAAEYFPEPQEPYEYVLPVWAAMRDREFTHALINAEEEHKAYRRFRRGLAIQLTRPMKYPEGT